MSPLSLENRFMPLHIIIQLLAQKAGVQIEETRELKKVYRKTRAE